MAIQGKGDRGRPEPADEAVEMPRRVLEKIVLRRGSLHGIGQHFARSNNWLWRQVRRNKSVDLVKAGEVLEQLEVPQRFFYEEILDQTAPYDPVWLLQHFREGNDLPRDPFLAEIHPRLVQALSCPIRTREATYKRRRPKLEELEESRYLDRESAKVDLEALLLELLGIAESTNSLSRRLAADLAFGLLVWAAIQRARGYRDDATDTYLAAFPWVARSNDPRIGGRFFYFSAHLLDELGQSTHAVRFCETSIALFQLAGTKELLAQAHLQRGISYLNLERWLEARVEGKMALRLSSNCWRTRVSGWLLLTQVALKRGNPRAAAAKVIHARKACVHSTYFEHFVTWREAVVLGALKKYPQAVRSFQSAIEGFEVLGQPLDIAFVGLDLAELLVESGSHQAVKALSSRLIPILEKLHPNEQALGIWMDLIALTIRGSRQNSILEIQRLRELLRIAAVAQPSLRSSTG